MGLPYQPTDRDTGATSLQPGIGFLKPLLAQRVLLVAGASVPQRMKML